MAFADYLHPDAVLFAPEVADKWQLIHAMVDRLIGTEVLAEARSEEARAALEARERTVSTGMEQGIAVPHAALEGLEQVIASIAVVPSGMEFDSLDGRPTRIIVLLLVPKHEKILHVRTLTEVARRLGDPAFRERVLQSASGPDLVSLWR